MESCWTPNRIRIFRVGGVGLKIFGNVYFWTNVFQSPLPRFWLRYVLRFIVESSEMCREHFNNLLALTTSWGFFLTPSPPQKSANYVQISHSNIYYRVASSVLLLVKATFEHFSLPKLPQVVAVREVHRGARASAGCCAAARSSTSWQVWSSTHVL